MGKNTVKVKFTITIKAYKDIPTSLIGSNLILSWSKGSRNKDKGSVSAVFCKEQTVEVNENFSFRTKLLYDESKECFEKKPLKLRLKSACAKSIKPKIVGKEKLDLSQYCSMKQDPLKEQNVIIELISKKYEPSKLSLSIVSSIESESKEPISSNEVDGALDDTSNSELTDFNEISSEEESLAESLNSATNNEQPKRRKRVKRSVTIGEQYEHSKVEETLIKSKSQIHDMDDEKLTKKAEDFKKRLEKYKNAVIESNQKIQVLEERNETLIKEHEKEKAKLIERINELENIINSKNQTSSLLKRLTTKVTIEEKIIVMVVLIIFLLLCVMDQFQKLIFG